MFKCLWKRKGCMITSIYFFYSQKKLKYTGIYNTVPLKKSKQSCFLGVGVKTMFKW